MPIDPFSTGQVQFDDLFGNVAATRAALGLGGGQGGDWTEVTKTVDESVANSAAVQSDDQLFFTPVNGGLYEFELVVIYGNPGSAGVPDIGVAFGQDTTMRGTWNVLGPSSGDGAAGNTLQCATSSSAVFGTAAANRVIKSSAGVYYGAGAAAGFWWAQGTADANPTIVRAGSILRYRRVA
jgi:hypothetical protein